MEKVICQNVWTHIQMSVHLSSYSDGANKEKYLRKYIFSFSVSFIDSEWKFGCCVFRTNVSPHLQSNNLLRWHAKRTTSAKIAKRNRIVDWLCVCTTQRWRQHNGIFFSILHHYTWKMAKPTRGFSTIHYTVYKCMYYWIGSLHFVSRFTQKWYTLLSRRR